MGAVVVKAGQILGEGRNRREAGKNALAHAELEAISQACKTLGTWRLTGCELYVTLEPCPMCTGAIINAHIDRVVYGADDERAGLLRYSGGFVCLALQPPVQDTLPWVL